MLSFLAKFPAPRFGLVVLALVASVACAARCAAQVNNRLIAQQQAGHHGLERAWFSRAELNTARNHVVRWVLDEDQLFLLTSAGVIQAMDAHTGRTQWTAAIGNPDYPSLGPAAGGELVALVNGSTLHALDRHTGRPLDQWRLGGAPGAGPAVTGSHIFVPLASGRVEAYPLDATDSSPWFYMSSGRTLVAPLTTSRSVVWSTDQGNLYLASSRVPTVRYRLETPSEFLAPAAFRENMIYAVSELGEMYAVDELNGSRRWKYATGYPTDRAPAVVGDVVFVTSEQPALHCVDAKTGRGLWEAENVSQFAAASEQRVYGVDDYGTLVVLDRATGAQVGRLPTDGKFQALVNDQTDRLYLLSDDGIVQCLHETGRRDPIYHNAPSAAAVAPPEEAPAEPESSEDRSTETEPAPPAAPPETEPAAPAAPAPFGGVESDQPAAESDAAPADDSPPATEEEDPFAF